MASNGAVVGKLPESLPCGREKKALDALVAGGSARGDAYMAVDMDLHAGSAPAHCRVAGHWEMA